MEEIIKNKRVYSEEEKAYRREAERKRLANPEYRAKKRAKDRERMENKEIRDRKRAMDRERQKAEGQSERRIASANKFRATKRFKEWNAERAEKVRIKSLENNVGNVCALVIVKCLDCGRFEVKRSHLVKDGKASSAYCNIHAKAHRRSHGVIYKRFNIKCADCGTVCIGAGNRKVCDPCSKDRAKALKATKEAKEAKRLLGGNHRRRARHRGCYVDTVRPHIVFDRDKWRCVGCGIKVLRSKHWQPNQATVDHIVPISRGGSHTYENCQTMCMMCNSKKEATMPLGRQLTVFDRVV